MIGGFVIEGTQPKTVLIRANGPSLTAFGCGDARQSVVATNSGQTEIAAERRLADGEQRGSAYTYNGTSVDQGHPRQSCSATPDADCN